MTDAVDNSEEDQKQKPAPSFVGALTAGATMLNGSATEAPQSALSALLNGPQSPSGASGGNSGGGFLGRLNRARLSVEHSIQGFTTSLGGAVTRDTAVAVNFIGQIAEGNYTGECANHVRRSLETAAGCQFQNRPSTADGYIDRFDQMGIKPINPASWSPQTAKAGDTVVFPACAGHPSGHMEMCVGIDAQGNRQYTSDTPQPHGFLANHNMAGHRFYVYNAQDIVDGLRSQGHTTVASANTSQSTHTPHRHKSGLGVSA